MTVFDAKRDTELINAGSHFLCYAHLTASTNDERSPDSRYCQRCFDFLKQEAKLLNGKKHTKWIPRDTMKAPIPTLELQNKPIKALGGSPMDAPPKK